MSVPNLYSKVSMAFDCISFVNPGLTSAVLPALHLEGILFRHYGLVERQQPRQSKTADHANQQNCLEIFEEQDQEFLAANSC